jgi:hypothetical protein
MERHFHDIDCEPPPDTARLTGVNRRGVAVGAVGAMLAACQSNSGGDAVPPRPTSLEGQLLSSASCHGGGGREVTLPPESVRRLIICPLAIDLPAHRRVNVARDGRLFARIVNELATPGASYGPDTACPAYADVPQKVLARGDPGWVRVDLPVDSCGHYDRRLLSLLTEARGAG